MSQAGPIVGGGGPPPPVTNITFVTSNAGIPDPSSPSVTALGILNLNLTSTSDNNNRGIRVVGGSGSNTLDIELTNRLRAAVIAQPTGTGTVLTLPLTLTGGSTKGIFRINYEVMLINDTTNEVGGYTIQQTIKNFAGVVTIINTSDRDADMESGLIGVVNVTFTTGASVINLNIENTSLTDTISMTAVAKYEQKLRP